MYLSDYFVMTAHSRSRLRFAHRGPCNSLPQTVYGCVKKPWDSQPQLKMPLILSDFRGRRL